MTKVDIDFDLARPIGDEDLDAIARVHGVYGIHRVKLHQPAMSGVTVEYDASRLSAHDVEAALLRSGIPVARR
jgi:hypothetical protein